MNLEAAEVELYLRKYQWALTNFTREVEEGYPFLRPLSDPSVQRFLFYMQQFPAIEQLELAPLIVKSCNHAALRLLGEALTQEEETKINSYRTALGSIPLPSVAPEPITKTFAVKRADTAKIVLLFLSSAFGSKPEKFESLNWFYTAYFSDWRFYTQLDFSGTWGTQIRCHHRLIRSDGKNWGFVMMPLPCLEEPVQVSQVFSLLSLYGVSPGVHYIKRADDVQLAAQTILGSYNRLFQAVPEWIDGLTIN